MSLAERRWAAASGGSPPRCTPPRTDFAFAHVSQQLPRVMRLRDVVLFNISAIVGLRVGKRLQNLGGHGTWLPGLIFVGLAIWSLTARGSATPFSARGLLPANLDLQSINLFATMTFAFAGLELAPTLGDEIHDPARTLRRGIALSGFAIVVMYVVGTAAMLVALPHETVSITNGMPQATAALVERLGAPWLAPAAAIVAILLVLGNLGGVGAWLAGSARLPFVAGVDGALPPAFARIHPRWETPYVGLLTQGVVATLFVIASLAGSTVKNAYLVLTQTTLTLFFIPYLYLFAAYLRLRRSRDTRTALVGLVASAAKSRGSTSAATECGAATRVPCVPCGAVCCRAGALGR